MNGRVASLTSISKLANDMLHSLSYSPSVAFHERLREDLRDSKIVHLTDVPFTDDVVSLYESLIGSLGQLLKKGERVDEPMFVDNQWLDVRYDARMANAFRHSNTEQPLHTDGAYVSDFDYDIVFLICLQQADHGGETVFLDGEQFVDRLSERDSTLLSNLESTPVRFSKGRMGHKTVPIIRRDAEGVIINWNQFRVANDNPSEVIELAQKFQAIVEGEMRDGANLVPIRLSEGEAVFFQDHRVLHGRRAFVGDRCLFKGVVKIPSGLPAC